MNGAMPSLRSRISRTRRPRPRPTPPRSWAVTLIKNRGVFLGFVEAPEKQGRAPNYNQSSAVSSTEVMRLRKSSLLFLPCLSQIQPNLVHWLLLAVEWNPCNSQFWIDEITLMSRFRSNGTGINPILEERARARLEGRPHSARSLVRVPGKHRNKDTAWAALENMIATRH